MGRLPTVSNLLIHPDGLAFVQMVSTGATTYLLSYTKHHQNSLLPYCAMVDLECTLYSEPARSLILMIGILVSTMYSALYDHKIPFTFSNDLLQFAAGTSST
jgi:hypothetical protein